MLRRCFAILARSLPAWGGVLLISARVVAEEPPWIDDYASPDSLPPACEEEEGADEEISYGPDPCEPRGTLLQWSYGTSFAGGPPGRDEPLVTDRPDFTEASVTVGRGVAQLEFGHTYTHDDEDGVRVSSHSFPETLLRVGFFAEWLEARVGWNYADETVRSGGVSTSANGAEDLYLGLKIALTPQEGCLPEMALMPQMTVPSGGGDFTADEVLPGVNWLYGWDLTDSLATGGSTQVNRAIDDGTDDAYLELAQSWTVGYSFNEWLGGYAEWFAFFPHSADTVLPEHYFNGGFTFLITNNLQFDVRAGLGLNEAADDFFVGAGGAVRY